MRAAKNIVSTRTIAATSANSRRIARTLPAGLRRLARRGRAGRSTSRYAPPSRARRPGRTCPRRRRRRSCGRSTLRALGRTLCRASVARWRRRSRNARRPSWPSSLVRRSAIRRAVSRPSSGASGTRRFAARAARGPARAQLAEDHLERGVEVVRHLVHEPDPERRLRVEALARDEVAARRRRSDLRERERRDHRRDDAQLDLGEGEDARPGVASAMSAQATSPAPAAERVPVHERQHRRRAAVDRFEHAPERERVVDVLVVAQIDGRAHPVDVGAGAEARPLTREHDRARSADVDERLGELRDQRAVERVPPLRPRERDAEDVAVPLHPQRRHRQEPRCRPRPEPCGRIGTHSAHTRHPRVTGSALILHRLPLWEGGGRWVGQSVRRLARAERAGACRLPTELAGTAPRRRASGVESAAAGLSPEP